MWHCGLNSRLQVLFDINICFWKLFAATDIKIWHGKTGKELGTVDTNQLKNNMADISPNGRFIAAAAFTADVKVGSVPCNKTQYFSHWLFSSYDNIHMFFRCGRLFIRRIVQWRRLTGLCNSRVTRSNSSLLTLFRHISNYSCERRLTSFYFRVLLLVCVSLRILRRLLLHQKMVPFEYGISMVCSYIHQPLCLLIFNTI